MNVLVIGDEHTYGFGLANGNLSYIGHFIRQIGLTGQAVSVESYAHLTMPQVSSVLAQLPLSRYDLIVLQLDHNLLEPTRFDAQDIPCLSTAMLPYTLRSSKPSSSKKLSLTNRLKRVGSLLRSYTLPFDKMALSVIMRQLRPYRHNVLLLTPFPHPSQTNQWLRQRSRSLLLHEADDQLFSVFDSNQVIRAQEEYFLATYPEHLNAVSHELIGRALFDFYLSAPTIVTVQTTRR